MASSDLARVKRNVSKMVGMGAPEQEIDAYISSEGTTVEEIKAFRDTPEKPLSGPAGMYGNETARAIGRVGRSAVAGAGGVLDAIATPGRLIDAGVRAASGSGPSPFPSVAESVKTGIDVMTGDTLQPRDGYERFQDGLIEFAVPGVVLGGANSVASAVATAGASIGYGTAQAVAPDSTAAGVLLPLAGALAPVSTLGAVKGVAGLAKAAPGAAVKVATTAASGLRAAALKTVAVAKEMNLPAEIKALDPAQRIIFQAIKAEGHNVDDALALAKQAKEAGIDLPVFQLLDSPTLRTYSKTLSEFGGGAKIANQAQKTLREKQIPEAVHKLFQEIGSKGLSVDENAAVMRQTAEDIMAQSLADLKSESKPLYDAVLTADNLIPEEHFADIKSRPVFQAAVARVVKKPTMQQYLGVETETLEDGAQVAKIALPKNSMKFLDAVQKEMETMAGSALAKADPELGSFDAKIIGDTKRTLLNYMDEAFPEYKAARSIYSEDLKEVKALREGPLGIIRDMSAGDSRQAARKIFKLNPPQIRDLRNKFVDSGINGAEDAWNRGVASYLEDVFENTKQGRNYRAAVMGNEIQRQRLAAAIPQKSAQIERFFGVLDEAYKAGQIGGSDTASKQAAQATLGANFQAFDDTANFLKHPVKASYDMLRRAYQQSVIDDPEGARKMAEYLFTPQGEELLQSLKKIEK